MRSVTNPTFGEKELRRAITVGYDPEANEGSGEEDPSHYPGSDANTFWVKLGAPDYEQEVGNQELLFESYDSNPYRIAYSDSGFIEEGTEVWVVLVHGKYFIMSVGGGPNPVFFKITDEIVNAQKVSGIRSNYQGNGSGDPEEVINWGAESTGSGGSNLLDGAPEGYLGLFVPVIHTEDNPDYQPDDQEPNYDPNETITQQIWAFAQGHCIIPPDEET